MILYALFKNRILEGEGGAQLLEQLLEKRGFRPITEAKTTIVNDKERKLLIVSQEVKND